MWRSMLACMCMYRKENKGFMMTVRATTLLAFSAKSRVLLSMQR